MRVSATSYITLPESGYKFKITEPGSTIFSQVGCMCHACARFLLRNRQAVALQPF